MTYLSGKTQKKKRYIGYGLLSVIFFLLIFFWPSVQKKMYGVLEPVVVGYGATKNSFTFFPEFFSTYLTSHKELASRQKELELEIERLENALAEKDFLIRENGSLVQATSSYDSLSREIVMYPLAEDITKLYSTVLLSKGFKDGITVDAMVYVRGQQAVCTIKEVHTATSRCLLLSSSSVTTEGVTSSSSINLSLVGRGGYFLANVVRDTPVAVGEKIYLRSNPKMVLGTVKHIMDNDQDTSWHLFIEGAYNPLTSSIFYVQP